jgi:hypothetical protein
LWNGIRGATLVGVPTGAVNGITVIDVDPRRGGDKWFDENRERLTTRVHRTRGGGCHLIFNYAAGLPNTADRIAPGVETKNDGKYVVWWAEHGQRVEGTVADCPGWIVDALTQPQQLPGSEPLKNRPGPLMTGEIPKSLYFAVKRCVPLSATVTRHHQRRVAGILSIVTRRTELRNDGLNIAAYCLRELVEEGIITYEVAEGLLLEAATVCGYAAKDGVGAALATIRSGLGLSRPLEGHVCVLVGAMES